MRTMTETCKAEFSDKHDGLVEKDWAIGRMNTYVRTTAVLVHATRTDVDNVQRAVVM
jgi:hypothetical protein